MCRRSQIAVLLAVSCSSATAANRVLGLAEAGKPFLVGSVETKPEAGPVPVVDGDQVRSLVDPVSFRLEGGNRSVLAENSTAGLRRYGVDGVYFYVTKGSIRFEARKQPLAICAQDRLYVPSIPASGEVAIENGRAQVRMTGGTMVRSGTDGCGDKEAPAVSLSGASGAGGGSAATTATATAASAGAASTTAAVGAVAIAAGTAAGLVSTIAVVASTPLAESPINPAQ